MAKKLIALVLTLVMAASLFTVCSFAEATEEEYIAWAEANGYVKQGEPLATSATEKKEGGVNFGAIDWSRELQEAAVKEWLKGGPSITNPDYVQDETGWSYRNMFQMATCYNNVANNTNLELVLDASTLNLLGVSEAGTSKINEFTANPDVCIAWSRQLRDDEEAAGYNYYSSYGMSFYGTVVQYGPEALETEEGQDKLINLFDKYYVTYASGWASYYNLWKDAADEAAVRAGKLQYITNIVSSGAMVVYEIVPNRIVITCPFMIDMAPTMVNAVTYTTVQEGEDKYNYDLGITDDFLDMAIAYKNEYLADEANLAAVQEYYTTGSYPMLDQYSAMYGMPTSVEYALMDNSCAGLKTQTTWTPAE